jgi:hypothetical protein
MDRRDVLKLGAATSLALLLQASPLGRILGPSNVEAKGLLYRGSRDGYIYSSADGGRTWQEMANFGPDLRVRVSRDLKGQVFARLFYQGSAFELNLLKDGRTWWYS